MDLQNRRFGTRLKVRKLQLISVIVIHRRLVLYLNTVVAVTAKYRTNAVEAKGIHFVPKLKTYFC
jgi:hypothetical protein